MGVTNRLRKMNAVQPGPIAKAAVSPKGGGLR